MGDEVSRGDMVKVSRILGILAVFFIFWAGCLGAFLLLKQPGDTGTSSGPVPSVEAGPEDHTGEDDLPKPADIPAYAGEAYTEINGNKPFFSPGEITREDFEHYSDLDSLGRCGPAYASVGPETLPQETRGPIGEIHPSGWQIANYHELIEGNYLYNRCHLIAYSLTGENANEKNLITGTRYLNTEGMQPFELRVLEYVRSTGNHVLYRVTPVFSGDNLLADGVLMEGLSVEDGGRAVCFCIFAYNVQPGISIDYLTGDSRLSGEEETSAEEARSGTETEEEVYVLNNNSHRFHRPSCDSVSEMKEKNKIVSRAGREEILQQGYEPCGRCKP